MIQKKTVMKWNYSYWTSLADTILTYIVFIEQAIKIGMQVISIWGWHLYMYNVHVPASAVIACPLLSLSSLSFPIALLRRFPCFDIHCIKIRFGAQA